VLEKRMADFKVVLQKQAGAHRTTVMIGRNMANTLSPLFGLQFAVWGYELDRHSSG